MQKPNNETPVDLPADAIETYDAQLPVAPDIDKTILNSIMLRLWKSHPLMEATLALEVIDGPYKGIIFGYGQFNVANRKTDDGMVPVKFSTKLYKAPTGFKKDEAWDAWTSEVLMAWLGHVATSNYAALLKVGVKGIH